MWDRVTIETKPVGVAVTLADAKAFCDIDYTDDDDLITSLIASATSKLDGPRGIGIACFTQTWELSLDNFPYSEIILPGWPVKSITAVSYTDTDGATQTIDAADYQLDIKGDRARLTPVFGGSWPSSRLVNGAVSITYVVGEAQDDIEPVLKLAIKQMVAHWYENREAISETSFSDVPMSATQIMRDYMRGGIAA